MLGGERTENNFHDHKSSPQSDRLNRPKALPADAFGTFSVPSPTPSPKSTTPSHPLPLEDPSQ
jgi:hypothetical protein